MFNDFLVKNTESNMINTKLFFHFSIILWTPQKIKINLKTVEINAQEYFEN